MRAILGLFFASAVALLLLGDASGQDGKEVTIKGELGCAKCGLNQGTTCANVVVVKKDKMPDVVYYYEPESHKKFPLDNCSEFTKGTVIGTVVEKDGKKIITVKEVKYDK